MLFANSGGMKWQANTFRLYFIRLEFSLLGILPHQHRLKELIASAFPIMLHPRRTSSVITSTLQADWEGDPVLVMPLCISIGWIA